jgi:NAD(P)-dependent dehydrogenase (short-subunit alcohol dehydrogenase family)
VVEPRFQKKIVFLTGAGSGFGRATALGFAREGAATVCLAERLPERLEAVCGEVESLGARAVPILVDLGDVSSCEQAVATVLEAAGRIDVLVVNHAAMSWATPFLELTDAEWEEELRVNLTSFFVLAQRAARSMAGSGGGVILFTASVNALGAGRGFAPYCVSKTGLVSLAQVMAVELAPLGIRVNCVSPGPADTQRSVDLVGEETMDRYRASFPAVPMNRLASAEDIAEAFLYLASDAASYVTGHNLVVDGGLTAQIYDLPD